MSNPPNNKYHILQDERKVKNNRIITILKEPALILIYDLGSKKVLKRIVAQSSSCSYLPGIIQLLENSNPVVRYCRWKLTPKYLMTDIMGGCMCRNGEIIWISHDEGTKQINMLDIHRRMYRLFYRDHTLNERLMIMNDFKGDSPDLDFPRFESPDKFFRNHNSNLLDDEFYDESGNSKYYDIRRPLISKEKSLQ